MVSFAPTFFIPRSFMADELISSLANKQSLTDFMTLTGIVVDIVYEKMAERGKEDGWGAKKS